MIIEPNKEISLHIILFNTDYAETYHYKPTIENIRLKNDGLYYQAETNQVTKLKNGLYNNNGLIRIKGIVSQLLRIFRINVKEIEVVLKNNIDSFCEICLNGQFDITFF